VGRKAAWPNQPSEEDLVLGIMLAAVHPVEAELRRLLAPHPVAVATTGVFCHGRPTYVHFRDPATGGSGACELGDLLLVVHYRSSGGEMLNALLLQAKRDKVSPDQTDDQWTLYNAWPPFVWSNEPYHHRQPRPRSFHAGAQYALLWSRASSAPRAYRAHPGSQDRYLHHELSDLLLFRSGRMFKAREWARAEGGGGWSELVWDLLDDIAIKLGMRHGKTHGRSSGSMLIRPGGRPIPLVFRDPDLALGLTVADPDVRIIEPPSGVDLGRGDYWPPRGRAGQPDDGESDSGVSALVIEVDARGLAVWEDSAT
jgi:hypothetical protein